MESICNLYIPLSKGNKRFVYVESHFSEEWRTREWTQSTSKGMGKPRHGDRCTSRETSASELPSGKVKTQAEPAKSLQHKKRRYQKDP
ncbi:hypothetical protein TNCT_253321 [Trichonephila clavata]|uniref:Uncharacterized protein n=1 Tax=Trichonephila clavata TaxID=2740835 RepID=A0A8X6GF24_TRICU|nr:hypothetical protein TNCT_253321 [Trichonephila clavata]